MGFNSESAAINGKKSKRGKSVSTELRSEIVLLSAELINKIDTDKLSDRDKINYLKAILPYALKRTDLIKIENQLPTHIEIEILQ